MTTEKYVAAQLRLKGYRARAGLFCVNVRLNSDKLLVLFIGCLVHSHDFKFYGQVHKHRYDHLPLMLTHDRKGGVDEITKLIDQTYLKVNEDYYVFLQETSNIL